MSTTIQGVIERAHTNERGISSILVNGTWYGTYKDSYKHLENTPVQFQAEQKGQYWNAKNVAPAELPKSAAPSAGGAPANISGDARQRSIVLQSSYKTAADVLGHVLTAGAVTLPKTKADQYDAILGLLDNIALRLFGNCIDPEAFIGACEAPGPVETTGGAKYNPVDA